MQRDIPDDMRKDAPLDVRGALDAIRHAARVAEESAANVVSAVDRLVIALAKHETESRIAERERE